MTTRILTLLVGALLIPGRGVAQQAPSTFVRLEVGRAEIHRASSSGAAVALRVGSTVRRSGTVRMDLGASYSGADLAYLTLEAGVELRPLPAARLTPVARVGAGLLAEKGFGGPVLCLGVALEAELSARTALRLGYQLAEHGGARGPNVWFAGLEARLGRRGL